MKVTWSIKTDLVRVKNIWANLIEFKVRRGDDCNLMGAAILNVMRRGVFALTPDLLLFL